MSRINTNVQSLLAQRVLGQNNFGLSQSLERLSTGLKIVRGKDDPAGLIASENLRSEIRAINTAIDNSQRADQVVNIAEGGLQEVSNLLTELQGLITASASSAGLSESEKQANQLQIDSILQTIDRVASATSFQGIKLLNGNFDYKVSSVAAGVTDYQINAAKFQGGPMEVDMIVTQSAQQAGLWLSMGDTTLQLGSAQEFFTIEIGGVHGNRQLSFANGTSNEAIENAINSYKDITGVEAKNSGDGLRLFSTQYGSSQYVSVTVVDDGNMTGAEVGVYNMVADDFNLIDATSKQTWATAANAVADYGQDLGATINGIQATANGRDARINTDFLDVQITLDTTTAQTIGGVGTGHAFKIAGGGADFQLAARVDIAGKVSLGISDIATRKLGSADTGWLSDLGAGRDFNMVDGNHASAQRVVEEAIEQVSSLRGRLGAFQKNTIGATIRSLGVAVENTAAAESVIRDADFAAETAAMTRNQILVAASTNVLALANQTPQNALQLLG